MLDADIEACFDSIGHTAPMDRVRRRVKDKRVLGMVKAFLKAGVLAELGENRDPTPARRKAASCLHCWRTSPCTCSTSTCRNSGANIWGRNTAGLADAGTGWGPGG